MVPNLRADRAVESAGRMMLLAALALAAALDTLAHIDALVITPNNSVGVNGEPGEEVWRLAPRLRGLLSPVSCLLSPHCLYTTPFFITNFTRLSAVMSFVGSPSNAARSANSPGFTMPI